MHKIKTPNSSRARRRGSLPELGDIYPLIDQTRALRLELCRLSSYEPIAESARAGVEALTKAGLALEVIAELLVSASAKTRKRSHHRKTTYIEANASEGTTTN